MRPGGESNPCIRVLQPLALPLGYRAYFFLYFTIKKDLDAQKVPDLLLKLHFVAYSPLSNFKNMLLIGM